MRYVLILSYLVVAVGVSVVIMIDGQFGSGASLMAASVIALFGASGARGSLYGSWGQKIVGVILGVIAVVIASLIANWGQATVVIFNVGFPAPLWVLIGALIGFVFTSRRDAEI